MQERVLTWDLTSYFTHIPAIVRVCVRTYIHTHNHGQGPNILLSDDLELTSRL